MTAQADNVIGRGQPNDGGVAQIAGADIEGSGARVGQGEDVVGRMGGEEFGGDQGDGGREDGVDGPGVEDEGGDDDGGEDGAGDDDDGGDDDGGDDGGGNDDDREGGDGGGNNGEDARGGDGDGDEGGRNEDDGPDDGGEGDRGGGTGGGDGGGGGGDDDNNSNKGWVRHLSTAVVSSPALQYHPGTFVPYRVAICRRRFPRYRCGVCWHSSSYTDSNTLRKRPNKLREGAANGWKLQARHCRYI